MNVRGPFATAVVLLVCLSVLPVVAVELSAPAVDGAAIGDGGDTAVRAPGGPHPSAANTRPADSDGDGLTDRREVRLGTDPTDPDTDGDFVDDSTEIAIGTNPKNPLTTILLFVVIVVTSIAIVVKLGRRWSDDESSGGSTTRPGSPADTEDGSETAIRSAGPDARADGAPDSSAGTAKRFMTDEERVLKHLRENGGRLPQKELTERTDWSKSKVSRLLSRMEDSGEIEKICVGRENLVALADAVPDGAKSALDTDE
jgi:hypothetical protein